MISIFHQWHHIHDNKLSIINHQLSAERWYRGICPPAPPLLSPGLVRGSPSPPSHIRWYHHQQLNHHHHHHHRCLPTPGEIFLNVRTQTWWITPNICNRFNLITHTCLNMIKVWFRDVQVTVSSPLAVSSIIDVDNEAANGIVHVVDAVF